MGSIEKILLITPSINMGGIQAAMANIANGFADRGLNVEMYALFQLEHFFELHSAVNFKEAAKRPEEYNVITRIISIIRNIKLVSTQSQAKEIIVYGRFYSALTLLATWGLGKRVFISDRASPLYRDKWYVEMLTAIMFFFIKPTGVIAQTNISAQFQRKRLGKNVPIQTIPNAIRDIKPYNIPKEKIILAVGRFGDHLKGFDQLIEAWAIVQNINGWKLVFAGGSENDDPQLIKQVKDLGIYNNIEFLGKVSNMDELYAKSSIFVIPSRCEGFPNALAEAMNAGIACISFDFIGGPRDIIDDGVNGLIVPNGNILALAKAIELLMQNKELRDSFAIKAFNAKERFSSNTIINRIIQFITL